MISVTPRARSRDDRAGDPLDGLVNLFDLGIVLAVAFLLAALSSLHLGGSDHPPRLHATAGAQIQISPARRSRRCPSRAQRTIGRGTQAGRRLPAGQRPARLRASTRPASRSPDVGYLWEQVRRPCR